MMVLRPAIPFRRDRRYIVAFRGVQDEAGATLPPMPPFAALRDRTASTIAGIHARRAHFEANVFPVLEAHGVARAELQLAWDFTTASARVMGPPVKARDAVLAAIGADGPEYVIDNVSDMPGDEHIALIVDGRAFVPSILQATRGTRGG
jgi:hypothetical protein